METKKIPKKALNANKQIRLGDRYIRACTRELIQDYVIAYDDYPYGTEEHTIEVVICKLEVG